MASAPRVIFVLGGPGAGKGTQCGRAETFMGIKHISAGDCLREERNNPSSDLGNMINDYIKEGRIVPVEITCSLIRKKMEKYGWNNGKFLIDGFPRNEDNLLGWNRTMTDVHIVSCICIDCSNSIMEERLMKRGQHSGRVDDNLATIKKRFETYTNETMPIIKYFESCGKCHHVDGSKSVEEVWNVLKELFGKL